MTKKLMRKFTKKQPFTEQLSKDLQTEFPGIRGFSARNIWRMKTFYEFYAENEKLPPVVAEIGWTQNCLILEKCKDKLKIEYYLRKTKEMGWSKAILKINDQAPLQINLLKTNFTQTKTTLLFILSRHHLRHTDQFVGAAHSDVVFY